MTVLVGALCQDGVVIGSDSSATIVAGQFRTIEHTVKKTFLVEPDVLFATTGSAGLGQRFEAIVRGLRNQAAWTAASHLDIAKNISRITLEDMASTRLNPGGFGALLAFPCRGSYHLYELDAETFQPEFKRPETWFVSMGSGQPIVDPFFGLLSRTLFRENSPRLGEGVFAALWALQQAILLNPGGINGPPQIGVLRMGNSTADWLGRILSDNELAEAGNSVQGVEEYLARYREQLVSPAATAVPSPPNPPPSVTTRIVQIGPVPPAPSDEATNTE
jgi:20S proteasome alpha/beta subunit